MIFSALFHQTSFPFHHYPFQITSLDSLLPVTSGSMLKHLGHLSLHLSLTDTWLTKWMFSQETPIPEMHFFQQISNSLWKTCLVFQRIIQQSLNFWSFGSVTCYYLVEGSITHTPLPQLPLSLLPVLIAGHSNIRVQDPAYLKFAKEKCKYFQR